MNDVQEERIYTVGEVNRLADNLLQGVVLWVEGEVSNLKPYPNYTFFSLSDGDASLSCIMFAGAMRDAACHLQEGMSVLARGRLGVYVRRGQFRLNVLEFQEAGEGRLRREFLVLMRKLSKEGLFDEAVKRPLPAYPDTVGLITSLEGAAVRDVVTNLTRRFRGARLVVRGVRVQGEDAVGDIVAAIDLFNRAFPVDVIILARGGGSLEDLQPFNCEEVVRAIRSSSIAVVTGVGHEPDMTLCDLAADLRASTPTGAAEAVVPAAGQVLSLLRECEVSLAAGLRRRLHHMERGLVSLEKRRCFSDASALTGQPMQRLAESEARLLSGIQLSVQRMERGVDTALVSLARYPREYRELPLRLQAAARKLSTAAASWSRWKEGEPGPRARGLRAAALAMLAREDGRVKVAASRLEAMSPLGVLARGYAIATRAGEAKPLTDGSEVAVSDMVDVRLHRGGLRCEVREVREPREEGKD
ncbi:MAG: exodeoxyribonuclease VII large subunit [Actinomycetota bacterium]